MTCHCTPSRKCLNCDLDAKRIARLKAKDHEEAIARGRIRYERNSTEGRGLK